jgi:hypothetical protein
MIYLFYPFLVVYNLLMTLVAVIIAPILPAFATQQDGWLDNHSIWGIGPRLPRWLNLFMTPDNSLDGDSTFERLNGRSYWSKVKWLWRNPAYSVCLRYLHNPYYTKVWGDKTIKDNDNAKAGWCFIKANGLFQFTVIAPIGFARCFRFTGGWNVAYLVDDNIPVKVDPFQATFAFSPRLSGFR